METELRDMANSLAPNTKARFVCPLCHGGTGREQSLMMRRGAGTRTTAHCFRATCSFGSKSVLTDGTSYDLKATSPTPTRPECYDGTIVSLPPDMPEWYPDDWGIGEYGKLIIPIRDSDGVRRGDVVRQTNRNTKYAKSLTYCEEGYDGMAWFYPDCIVTDRKVVIVEDPLSAARLAYEGCLAISLLGVNLSIYRIEAIRAACGYTPVNLALDADASRQALRLAKMFRNVLDIRVHRVFHDVKDMDDDELLNFLGVLVV